MSRTLNLADRLLAMGHNYQRLGRGREALTVLGRLARLGHLPAETAEQTQALLAEIHLQRKQYRRARRHLTAALLYQPRSVRYHNLMADALDADDRGDGERAAEACRRSLELDPDQPDRLSAYGLLLLRLGRGADGLEALRRAAALAPDDPAVLGRLVEGLCAEGLSEEARQLLRAARFRNPRDGRFQRLWDDFQFQQLHRRQQDERRRGGAGADDRPVVLPFLRPVRPAAPAATDGRRIRRDPPTPLPPPHRPRPAWLPDKRHA
jgi:tetratricopeptide (TPR) repeat protein